MTTPEQIAESIGREIIHAWMNKDEDGLRIEERITTALRAQQERIEELEEVAGKLLVMLTDRGHPEDTCSHCHWPMSGRHADICPVGRAAELLWKELVKEVL